MWWSSSVRGLGADEWRRVRASFVLCGAAWGYWWARDRFHECIGDSMYPTLGALGTVVYSQPVRDTARLRVGDLVVLRSPSRPGTTAAKRIVALPGAAVYDPLSASRRSVVPYGCVWVAGDNEKSSLDSRYWGPISQNLIAHQVTWVVWPPSQFGPIKPPPQNIIQRYNIQS